MRSCLRCVSGVASQVGYDRSGKKMDAEVLKKYIFGGHVSEYMEEMEEEEPEKYMKHFSKFLEEDVSGGDLEDLFAEVCSWGAGGCGGADCGGAAGVGGVRCRGGTCGCRAGAAMRVSGLLCRRICDMRLRESGSASGSGGEVPRGVPGCVLAGLPDARAAPPCLEALQSAAVLLRRRLLACWGRAALLGRRRARCNLVGRARSAGALCACANYPAPRSAARPWSFSGRAG
jgi:hypothetical protein